MLWKNVKSYCLCWVNRKLKKYGLKSMVCIAINVKIPAVMSAHLIYPNVQMFTSNGYNWRIRCHINCLSINILHFLSSNIFYHCMIVVPHTLAKQ